MNNRTVKCEFCGESVTNLRLCGACKNVRYCNTEHQRRHWKIHKTVCVKLKGDNDSINHGSSKNNDKSIIPLDRTFLDAVVLEKENKGPLSNGRTDQEADLSTSVDSEEMKIESGRTNSSPNTFHQLKLKPDNQSIAEQLGPDWLSNVTRYVLRDLNSYGFCAVDNFIGSEKAQQIMEEVKSLHSLGKMTDGQVLAKNVENDQRGLIRGDKIVWVGGAEENCQTISQLITTVDTLMANANKHIEAGKLAEFDITFRTKAMVACYPGQNTHYVKHVDNPNCDGRCVTAIYYVNKNWSPEDGGILRIYPKGMSTRVAQIEPLFDRMLFFWSDRRNPHEVLPSKSTRYAVTVWYLDQRERDLYKVKFPTEFT